MTRQNRLRSTATLMILVSIPVSPIVIADGLQLVLFLFVFIFERDFVLRRTVGTIYSMREIIWIHGLRLMLRVLNTWHQRKLSVIVIFISYQVVLV